MSRPQLPPRLGKTKSSPNFYILWHDGTRPCRESTGTSDPGEAQERLKEFLQRSSDARQKLRRPDEVEISEALDLYLAKIADKPSARSAAAKSNTLLEFWTNRKLSEVTPESAKAYAAWRLAQPGRRGKKSRSMWTVYGDMNLLRTALNSMVQAGLLTRAPYVPVPGQPESKDVWLEHYEAQLLIDSCVEEHIRLFVELALYTGASKAKLLEMKWAGQIDFDRGRIFLDPPGQQRADQCPPVPMNEHVRDLLLKARQRARSRWVIEYFRFQRTQETDSRARRPPTLPDGGHVGDIKVGFNAALERARKAALEKANNSGRGSRDEKRWREAAGKLKETTTQTLRHTAGVWMAQSGVPIPKIANWLGRSVAETARIYAHHNPDYLADAANAIEARATRGRSRPMAI